MRRTGAEGWGCGRKELGGLRLREDNEANRACGLGETSIGARNREHSRTNESQSVVSLWPQKVVHRVPHKQGEAEDELPLVTTLICLVCRLTGTVEKPPRKRKSRDLPQYGQKQWQSYFGRTFDVYTKLWKFQQQHRQVLDNRYGLKRWQIGEIASKIGQLYYHYYLRTSETSYLNEAFSFYSAIRQRSYYSQVNKEDRPELVVKKLRYYARFIVVCLLLNKMDVVKDLVKADPVMVLNDDNTIVITSNRLAETGAPLLEQGMIVGQLSLADALIIGNCNNQVKFSELTVDMFRMLQALEREPMNLASQMNKPGIQESADKPTRRENPHKYLLYKPTFSQLYTFLAASFKELPANSVLLIYLSATGVFPTGRSDGEGPYDFGGVLTNSNRDIINGDAIHKRNQSHKEMHWKPLFIIVDSSNSVAYKNFTNLFGQPLVCLLSPTAYPKALQDLFSKQVINTPMETRNYPESYPQLPRDETVENPHLQKHILELASILDVRNIFFENSMDDY
ncbi:hypothetical protein A6R68_11150 [Neotoma lepida]|uniref:Protein SCAI n=1 Tax=Neotoma lepida TaxID=56216 RepID=A0A1A6FUT7_NEOLE|nr:hypothetical protein A6R68_11150 [Neotoma lepida]